MHAPCQSMCHAGCRHNARIFLLTEATESRRRTLTSGRRFRSIRSITGPSQSGLSSNRGLSHILSGVTTNGESAAYLIRRTLNLTIRRRLDHPGPASCRVQQLDRKRLSRDAPCIMTSDELEQVKQRKTKPGFVPACAENARPLKEPLFVPNNAVAPSKQ